MPERGRVSLKMRGALLGLTIVSSVLVPAQAQPMGQTFMEHLHSDLRLNPAQEALWSTFQQAYRIAPDEIARERDADARMPSLTGPQRADLAVDMAEQDLAGLRRRDAALKVFYAALSPQQQQIFDRDTLPPGPGRR